MKYKTPNALEMVVKASDLAAKLFDPALRGEAEGLSWDPERLEWR